MCLAGLALPLASCERPPAADSLPEWTPADHHSTDDDKLEMRGREQGSGPGGATPQANEVPQLVDITWRQQCATCHGAHGKGDGQLGPMVKAPDLSALEWQSKVTDAEIAATIRNGKGKMPKFDVPEPVIQGLVARVRASRAE
jgi:Cytochrome C oxidase, cbb3-type, subunit III